MKLIKIMVVLLVLCGCGKTTPNGPKYHVGQVLRTAVGNKEAQVIDGPYQRRRGYAYTVRVDNYNVRPITMYEYELFEPGLL